MIGTSDPYLQRFLALARRGKSPDASSGEKICHKLALAIIDGTPRLDSTAIHGLKEFIDLASSMPNAAEDLLRGHV